MIEEWKDIEGYEDRYKVSNTGKIVRKAFVTSRKQPREDKIIKATPFGNSYRVSLSNKGKRKSWKVHRLVAKHFIDKPEGKDLVVHIDGDISNNRVDNLKWADSNDLAMSRPNERRNKGRKLPTKRIIKLKNEGGSIKFDVMSDASQFLGRYKNYISDARKCGQKNAYSISGEKYELTFEEVEPIDWRSNLLRSGQETDTKSN